MNKKSSTEPITASDGPTMTVRRSRLSGLAVRVSSLSMASVMSIDMIPEVASIKKKRNATGSWIAQARTICQMARCDGVRREGSQFIDLSPRL